MNFPSSDNMQGVAYYVYKELGQAGTNSFMRQPDMIISQKNICETDGPFQ